MFLVGISTAVNSLWEDLADFRSDYSSNAKTMLVLLGVKPGIYLTILMGYSLVPLMIIVGVLFKLNMLYFIVLLVLISYLSFRIVQNRHILLLDSKHELDSMLNLGERFSADFVIVALVFTLNLMICGYLTYHQIFFF
jgi:4-hydroxybenzoate polyprenyltransferase